MPKTSQTKKTNPAVVENNSIKTEEEVASKLDTIVSLLEKLINTVSKELAKEKGLTSNDLFPPARNEPL